jgi:hypothetical protein
MPLRSVLPGLFGARIGLRFTHTVKHCCVVRIGFVGRVSYRERLNRIHRMIESALPITHSAENPKTNQVKPREAAMRMIRRPNQIAAKPMSTNRTMRTPKT